MATVNRRRTSTGEWRYDVRYRVNGRPVERAFKRRRDAEAFRRRLVEDELAGVLVDPRGGRRTFAEVAVEWLASNPGKRPSSWARDEVAVRKHLVPHFGAERIERITASSIQALVNDWSAHHAPGTVKRNYGVVRAILRFAVQRHYLGTSPCRGVHLPEQARREVRLIDAADLTALAAAMGDYGLMAYVGAQLGLRWGEVAGLRAGRLMADTGTVAVIEQVTRGLKGRTVLGPPKSAAGRRVSSFRHGCSPPSWTTPARPPTPTPSCSPTSPAVRSTTPTGADGCGFPPPTRPIWAALASTTSAGRAPATSYSTGSTPRRPKAGSVTPTPDSPSTSTPRSRAKAPAELPKPSAPGSTPGRNRSLLRHETPGSGPLR